MNQDFLMHSLMSEYGLSSVYQGYQLHGDYPLLKLRGALAINDLLESPHLNYAAAQCCTLAELWANEQVTVTTTPSNLVMVQTEDNELLALIRQHFRNASLDAQRNIFQVRRVPEMRLRDLVAETQDTDWNYFPLGQHGQQPLPDFLDEH